MSAASRGVFLRDFRRVAPNGHHIAYEPVPVLHEALTREFPEMDIRRKALSDHAGQSHFVHLLESGLQGFSRLQDFVTEGSYPTGHRTETLSVDTVRLDDDLPEGWLPDFVKIDVEGAELLALRGPSTRCGRPSRHRPRARVACRHVGGDLRAHLPGRGLAPLRHGRTRPARPVGVRRVRGYALELDRPSMKRTRGPHLHSAPLPTTGHAYRGTRAGSWQTSPTGSRIDEHEDRCTIVLHRRRIVVIPPPAG